MPCRSADVSYGLQLSDGLTCDIVSSLSECSAAAAFLGLSETTPRVYRGLGHPPGCSFYYGKYLYFSANGNSYGTYSSTWKRICRTGRYFA